MSAESMAEFYDAAEQFETSSDDSDEVCLYVRGLQSTLGLLRQSLLLSVGSH